jgi:hypothetical protein
LKSTLSSSILSPQNTDNAQKRPNDSDLGTDNTPESISGCGDKPNMPKERITAIRKKPTDPVKVRFLKDYRTQIPRPGVPNAYDDKLYHAGDVVELQRWNAENLLKREIVELVA